MQINRDTNWDYYMPIEEAKKYGLIDEADKVTKVKKDADRDYLMSPEEAKKYGLIDEDVRVS